MTHDIIKSRSDRWSPVPRPGGITFWYRSTTLAATAVHTKDNGLTVTVMNTGETFDVPPAQPGDRRVVDQAISRLDRLCPNGICQNLPRSAANDT